MSLEAWGDEDPNDIECSRCEARAEEHEQEVKDLTMMVKRLTRALASAAPDHAMVHIAKEWIMRSCEPYNTMRTIEEVLADGETNEDQTQGS